MFTSSLSTEKLGIFLEMQVYASTESFASGDDVAM
jgi:hypothetical protein